MNAEGVDYYLQEVVKEKGILHDGEKGKRGERHDQPWQAFAAGQLQGLDSSIDSWSILGNTSLGAKIL